MLIEENIKGTNNGMKAARKKPDARPLISPGLARIGARKDTEITTGIAMNLARSFRLVSALNSFIARSDDKELKLKPLLIEPRGRYSLDSSIDIEIGTGDQYLRLN